MNQMIIYLAATVSILLSHSPLWAADLAEPEQAVFETERAFAQSMAQRDFETFKSFLSEEAVFFSRGEPTRGAQAVANDWQGFFEGAEAPFSWEPEIVAVLESGSLALSSGPVFNTEGERVGTFNSIWQRDKAGQWKVIFDKGGQYCPTADQSQ